MLTVSEVSIILTHFLLIVLSRLKSLNLYSSRIGGFGIWSMKRY